ncbi:MAG: single-stranded DNA-binding protein [Candidatus Paceibacterota bacterium]|jgi:single-strand DNA-binding protein
MNLNKVFIIGRITNDIELRATPSGQPVTSFNVATNRVWTDKAGAKQEEAEFHSVVVWAKQAELASQFLSKGSLVMIEGRLRTRSWKDNNNVNHKVTEIISERIQFGPRSANSAGQSNYTPKAKSSAPTAPIGDNFSDPIEDLPQISVDGGEDIKPEDLPF